jgi:aminoglycoside phosphotransferase family enzyme/predicted kinase
MPVTRDTHGKLALKGDGDVIDWVVVMNRFDQDGLFDRLALTGGLNDRLLEVTAEVIAGFHHDAAVKAGYGGAVATAAIVENNARCFAESAANYFDAGVVARLNDESRRWAKSLASLLDERRERGLVRHCHGDLHLRNLVLLEGKPTLFDAIEFSDDLAHIDVLYDLAFLVMDLDHRGLHGFGNTVLNRYLDITGDDAGLAAMPLFLSMRAAIRAHVSAAAQEDTSVCRDYMNRALVYLDPPPPRLIAIGGLSGTGKSLLARTLAPDIGRPPGARVLRTDVLRKRLAGSDAFERLGPKAYTADMTERTYQALYDAASAALLAGHCVIADAVFSKPAERQAILKVAQDHGCPFHGLWLDAQSDALIKRVEKRTDDASDAAAAVVRQQLTYDLGTLTWTRIDASGMPDKTLRAAQRGI